MEFKEVDAFKYFQNSIIKIKDKVVEEKIYNLFVNNKLVKTFSTIESNLEYLVVGYLFSNSMITDFKNVAFMNILNENIYVRTKSDNSKVSILISNFVDSADLFLPFDYVISLMKEFQNNCELFKKTGGVHSSALVLNKKIVFQSSDIGRYNSIDKVIGYCVKNRILNKCKVFLMTGRVNYDIILKISTLPFVKMIISHSAVSSMAIKLAKDANIQLLGFVRGERFNRYN